MNIMKSSEVLHLLLQREYKQLLDHHPLLNYEWETDQLCIVTCWADLQMLGFHLGQCNAAAGLRFHAMVSRAL